MSRITKEEIEKTKCGRFLLSDENIYLSIYSLNSYVFEYNLLNTEDRILYHRLQDKFDARLINRVITRVRKQIIELLDEDKYIEAKVYFKPKKLSENGELEFRPLHSTDLITQIAIVSMLHLFVYEIPEEEEGDPKLRLSNLSRLIPSDFYGNRISVKPEYLFKPWKQQYQKYNQNSNDALMKYHTSLEYKYEVTLDLENFFPTINPIIIYHYVINHLPAYLNDEEREMMKRVLQAFLKEAERGIINNPTEIVNLFPPKSGELSGINYISNLLWALEILAWSPEYLVHSISVLGLLEALPYERTNWTNTPINSIVSILLPWYPQTMADLEKRKNALKCLKTDNPRVFWSTLKKLLPNKTRSTSGNPRPKYLKLEIPEEVKVTNAEVHECYVYLVELAVDTARNENEKLVELIDQLGYMYEPTLTDYLECLENSFEFGTDENTFEVWLKLRECMARIEPTEGKVIYKQLDRIQQLIEKMEPTDIRVKHREWYLGNRYLFDKGNYANRWKMLEDKKLSAVKEIFDEYGSEEVERFGCAVKNVHDVANKLGRFLRPNEMSSIIEKCFIGILSKEFTINCLISFVYTQGAEKLLETSLCQMEDEFMLEILSKIPFSLQLLDVINQVLDDDTAYWEKGAMPYSCYDAEELKIIVEKLVACKRYATAVNIIGHSECEAVINAECIYKLMKLAGTEESIGVETLDDYAAQKIIGWFQQQEDIDLELRSDIEFIYLPMLDEYSEVRPRALNTRLSLEPEYFCSLIELFYKERNGEKREIELNKSLSDRLYEILFQFKVIPGIDWNGNFDAKRFDYWMKTVKTWSRDNDRYEVAMHTVGSGLSYAELDEDKLPQTAIIEELNRVENEELRRGYYLGIINQRGVHWIDPEGKPELELAEDYENRANTAESRGYSRYAGILRVIGDEFKREARRNALRARNENDDIE